MTGELLQTKMYAPERRSSFVPRPRLIEKLNLGLQRGCKLTLVSAPAGFGKTTLVSEWVAGGVRPAAWLSLDEGDADLTRFLTYFVAALQKLVLSGAEGTAANVGRGMLAALQSNQPPPGESILAALLNEIFTIREKFILVLDDYHVVDSPAVDRALTFLLDQLPSQMHLVITTREDPSLPLARLRARGQLTELRAADLRFTIPETAVFLRQMMGLDLTQDHVAALEARTEGWIAGLQLASISLQGRQDDADGFIKAFSGSHRYVLDYLVEEVLVQQPETVQRFLLQTSILERLCGSLCDAVSTGSGGQETLESLERANLFIVPLDNERRWYRYHHLFASLLRQRLEGQGVAEVRRLHARASDWYEKNDLEVEAFHHATAAGDMERAARLIEGEGMPLYYRGVVAPVRNWLETLPGSALDARPSLWVAYASTLTMSGRPQQDIEEVLQAAEAALQNEARDSRVEDLNGQIAAIRAMMAVPQNQVETVIGQSRRALELLHPDNVSVRTTATWTLGYAYQVQGERLAARQAYEEAIAYSQASGNVMTTLAATTSLAQVQETENRLHQAAKNYRRALELVGEPPWPTACEAYVGLARIHYQWNDLDAARRYDGQSLELARQLDNVDTPAACGVLLARLSLAAGDAAAAARQVAETEEFVHRRHFLHWLDALTAVRIRTLLCQGHLAAAAQLAERHDLPLSRARVHLAQGEATAALEMLEPVFRRAVARDWADERLNVLVLQALAYAAQDETGKALRALADALALAAPGGLIRVFIDEGRPMAALLKVAAKQGVDAAFVHRILGAFDQIEEEAHADQPVSAQSLLDPLTGRELEVLRLLGTELNGPEIARELVVSLNTMRTHTKNIYAKLGVNSRRAAVRRAEDLNLL